MATNTRPQGRNKAKLDDMQTDIDALRADVTALRDDVTALRDDVKALGRKVRDVGRTRKNSDEVEDYLRVPEAAETEPVRAQSLPELVKLMTKQGLIYRLLDGERLEGFPEEQREKVLAEYRRQRDEETEALTGRSPATSAKAEPRAETPAAPAAPGPESAPRIEDLGWTQETFALYTESMRTGMMPEFVKADERIKARWLSDRRKRADAEEKARKEADRANVERIRAEGLLILPGESHD